jgi:CelD/BcsL family acetyltransferase involved in cellulose biosynthesis
MKTDGPHAVSKVTLIRSGDIDNKLRTEWRRLGQNAEIPNPYFCDWFLEAALNHLDIDKTVHLCVIRGDDNYLIGILPLTVGNTYAKLPLKYFAVWKHQHCYNAAPLIERGRFAEAFVALFNWLDANPEGVRFIRFPFFPLDDRTRIQLREVCAQMNRSFKIQAKHQRAVLNTGGPYDNYLSSIYSGKKRKELRRQANRFSELGDAQFVRMAPAERFPNDDSTMDAYLKLEQSGWKGSDADGIPLAAVANEVEFFRNALTSGADAGAVDCLALTLDDKPIAMLFLLRIGGHLTTFKTSFNEGYAAYSPGARLLMEATRRFLEDPSMTFLDSCARENHPLANRLWPERLDIVQINIPAKGVWNGFLLTIAACIDKSMRALQRQFSISR